jgi:hypothetical protein
MSGVKMAFVVGAIVAIVGALLMVARLPSKPVEAPTTYPTEPNSDPNN